MSVTEEEMEFALAQHNAAMLGEAIPQKSVLDHLAHYGVKGMQWGVRKDRKAGLAPQDVTVKRALPAKKIKTTGGKGHAPSAEAIAKAEIRQKGKASKVQSLTNQELKIAMERMRLEQQYAELAKGDNPSIIRRGQNAVKGILGLKKTVNDVKGLKGGGKKK